MCPRRFGFALELLISLALPVASLLVLILTTIIVVPFAIRWTPAQGLGVWCKTVFHRGELWDLVLFAFLFEYAAKRAIPCTPHANPYPLILEAYPAHDRPALLLNRVP